jgi:hypothetical protein
MGARRGARSLHCTLRLMEAWGGGGRRPSSRAQAGVVVAVLPSFGPRRGSLPCATAVAVPVGTSRRDAAGPGASAAHGTVAFSPSGTGGWMDAGSRGGGMGYHHLTYRGSTTPPRSHSVWDRLVSSLLRLLREELAVRAPSFVKREFCSSSQFSARLHAGGFSFSRPVLPAFFLKKFLRGANPFRGTPSWRTVQTDEVWCLDRMIRG